MFYEIITILTFVASLATFAASLEEDDKSHNHQVERDVKDCKASDPLSDESEVGKCIFYGL